MEFSRQEYWSGLPFPAPGDVPDPEMESMSSVSPALIGGYFTTEPPGKPSLLLSSHNHFTTIPTKDPGHMTSSSCSVQFETQGGRFRQGSIASMSQEQP